MLRSIQPSKAEGSRPTKKKALAVEWGTIKPAVKVDIPENIKGKQLILEPNALNDGIDWDKVFL